MDDEDFDDLLGECCRKHRDVFHRLANAVIHDEDELIIDIRRRSKSKTTSLSIPAQHDAVPEQGRVQQICFPGKTAAEAWRFTVVIRILELIHEALRTGVTISKRDIYYRDPALFGNQAHVDRYVDEIAFTFDVPRSRLNVSAVAKGLIAGAVSFCRRDGSTFNAVDDSEGILVPSLRDILSVDMSNVKWILVIEKEATFRSIAASKFWDIITGEGVILTGKGYPDIATRSILRFLSSPSPQNGFCSLPVHGLVDFDPDGLAILSVYKYGSIALAHESANLRVPQISWLGLRREQLMVGEQDPHMQQGMLSLSPRDRQMAIKMLQRTEDTEMFSALQHMLNLNIKAELQILESSTEGLVNLLLQSGLGVV